MTGLKVLLFDLGRVLIDFDFAAAVRRLESLFPVNIPKLVKLFTTSSLADDFDKGRLSGTAFFEAVQKEMHFPISMDDFIGAWNGIFTEKADMVELVLKLKEKYPALIISNTNPWHLEHLKKHHPWVLGFKIFIASCDVKIMKPDPEIYRLALKKAGAGPEEAFYVDDIRENVVSARKLGIDSVQFKGYPAFLKEVKLRGLGSGLTNCQ